MWQGQYTEQYGDDTVWSKQYGELIRKKAERMSARAGWRGCQEDHGEAQGLGDVPVCQKVSQP
jgi:hypothetical protein